MNRVSQLTLLAPVLLLAACTALPSTGESGSPAGAGSTAGGTQPRAKSLVVADGHGWSSSGLDGTVPAAGSCHLAKAADGEPLPDPKCTPGAVDPKVTSAGIDSTICRKGGYTSSVRPPESLTEPVKRKLLAAYGIPENQISKYELDHLVELASGGASDISNLWPEPDTFQQFRSSSYIHNDKDAVEDYTYRAICDGKTTVTAVQNAVATNWTTAVQVLGLPPIPSDYKG